MKRNALITDRLVRDLKVVVEDGEELLRATAGEVGERARQARDRLSASLVEARHTVEDKAVAGAKATDHAIREHPYESLGIAFGLGILIGVLIIRR
jgi:ElaB/YqjD/DUF883 family membrane-anchored ribosome-binding protein